MDATIDLEKLSSKEMQSKQGWTDFLDTHAEISQYQMLLFKCGKLDCKFCKPPKLPMDEFAELVKTKGKRFPFPVMSAAGHFKKFHEVYGTDTTDDLFKAVAKRKPTMFRMFSSSMCVLGQCSTVETC